jgi:hypothetical protein
MVFWGCRAFAEGENGKPERHLFPEVWEALPEWRKILKKIQRTDNRMDGSLSISPATTP